MSRRKLQKFTKAIKRAVSYDSSERVRRRSWRTNSLFHRSVSCHSYDEASAAKQKHSVVSMPGGRGLGSSYDLSSGTEDELNSAETQRSSILSASSLFYEGIPVCEKMGPVTEFFSEKAAASEHRGGMDEDNNIIKYSSRGRRPCIISTLDLGDDIPTTEEDSGDTKSYPGDLVLVNGQALRQPSPPIGGGGGKSSSHYGSEGSLIDGSNAAVMQEKTKSLKNNKSFLNKMLAEYTCAHDVDVEYLATLRVQLQMVIKQGGERDLSWKNKKSSPSLEHFLLHDMEPSSFKDERLAGYKHLSWREIMAPQETDRIEDISETEMSRRHAVWELFTNECTFLVDHLMVLKHCFMEPLKKCQVEDLLMEVDPHQLFGNLDELCHLSITFCKDFLANIRQMSMTNFGSTDYLCDCLDKMTSNSRDGDIYHTYLLNYKSALTYLESLRNSSEDYATFEKFCEMDSRCNRLSITALLVAPMQHWTRLPLILQRIRKHTTNPSDVLRLDMSMERVVSSLQSLENKMEWLKTFERVKEIEKHLVWPTINEIDSKAFIPESLRNVLSVQPKENLLHDQVREVIYEGPIIVVEKEKFVDSYVFLFSDLLLITKMMSKNAKKSKGRTSTIEKSEGYYHVLKQPISVDAISVHDIGATEASNHNLKNAFVIVQRNSFQQVVGVFTMQAHTSFGKQRWLSSLRESKEKYIEALNSSQASRDPNSQSREDAVKLLKNSQVLEITTSTLPRKAKSTASPHTHTRPESYCGRESYTHQHSDHGLLDKRSRTYSTGCINTPKTMSTSTTSPTLPFQVDY